jgi:hypothetical protein
MMPSFSLLFSLSLPASPGSPLANPRRFLHPEPAEDDDIAELGRSTHGSRWISPLLEAATSTIDTSPPPRRDPAAISAAPNRLQQP